MTGSVRIKICGVMNPEDALAAVEAGADLIGINFVPGSPREVDLKTALQICDALEDSDVELVGVEAGGLGNQPGQHASPLSYGEPGILHGSYSFVMQDEDGQTCDVHSASAGLDYPGVGPEHSYWKSTGRVRYTNCGDDEALKAFDMLARTEGILPALESAHAIAAAVEIASKRSPSDVVAVCLSGRGDKDAGEIARLRGESNPQSAIQNPQS